MTQVYDPASFEPRWQAHWVRTQVFRALDPGTPGFDPAAPKSYVLGMFPYPSGSGLHVGHGSNYVATDVIARKHRMEGCNVLHPTGWDAFGLPAEQYAIQTGKHPAATTAENTRVFRTQLQRIGISYDWEREINTSDPAYYKWTQWIFARLFEAGLVYRAVRPVWWCDELKTVLSNEEVINGRSERGDHPCVQRPLQQWMLRITAYAERLLEDLDGLDWPESIKIQQREWIGRSDGAAIRFAVAGFERDAGVELEVFTTRPDTIFGATFMVVAPEHPLVGRITTEAQRAAVERYVAVSATKSELERTDLAKTKTGVFTGAYALNPVFDPATDSERAQIPIWVADYVLAGYGTGAIMAVPGQDQRDWEFARTYDLPIVRTVAPPPDFDGEAYTGAGLTQNSAWLDGLDVDAAKARAIAWLSEHGCGQARVNYKMRDWLFSRQRYWGEPFPLLIKADGSVVRVPDADLPVELPPMDDFEPSADGSAPLARVPEWVAARDPESGEPAVRSTDVMPGWAGSCWYWLRFMDPTNDRAPFAPEAERYWGPVDVYLGGASHAVMHLLYARFWHKVLYDLGLVSTKEPFQRLFNQGMVTVFGYRDATGRTVPMAAVEERDGRWVRAADGAPLEAFVTKMAKSLGNVVDPVEIIDEYGADTLRLYLLFMGPVADSKPWNPRDIAGCRRFLERAWRVFVDEAGDDPIRAFPDPAEPEGDALELERALQQAIQRASASFEHYNFNTAIAACMSFVKEATRRPGACTRAQAERFVRLLAPFAPHIGEELWSRLGAEAAHGPLTRAAWPSVDQRYLVEDEVELVVQVQGKLRGRARVRKDADRAELERVAREVVGAYLDAKQVVKTVVVPGKLVNFVVR